MKPTAFPSKSFGLPFLLLLLLLTAPILASAQHLPIDDGNQFGHFHQPFAVSDWEALTGVELSAKASKRVAVGLNLQTRFNNNASQLKAGLVELTGRYKVGKALHFKAGFRHGQVPVRQWIDGPHVEWGHQNRLMAATYLNLKRKGWPVWAQLRLRGEQEWNSSAFREYTFVRMRLKVKAKVARWFGPYASVEQVESVGDVGALTFTRWEAGAKWRINKYSSLRTFYRYERHFQGWNLYLLNSAGVVWSYRFHRATTAAKPTG